MISCTVLYLHSCLSNVLMQVMALASHILKLSSPPPPADAMREPSGEKQHILTLILWPINEPY